MDDVMISKKSPGLIVGGAVLCAVALAGAVIAMIFAFSGTAGAKPAAVNPPTASVPVAPVNPAHPVAPTNGNTPAPVSSAYVANLQRELGELNYYEGPVNGEMTAQTVQSIKYLQRDADLPQTGYFDQVTYLALQQMLVHGNNQMGG